jgi:hypothetical protein
MSWSLCGLDVGKFLVPNFSRSRHFKLDGLQLFQNRVLEFKNCWAFECYCFQSGFELFREWQQVSMRKGGGRSRGGWLAQMVKAVQSFMFESINLYLDVRQTRENLSLA